MKTSLEKVAAETKRLAAALLGGILCASQVFSADVTIAWDTTSEPDISGYNVYYQQGTDGPPYNLFEHIDAQEIDPANPSIMITGLVDGVYYLVVTAVDTAGVESLYSNSACARISGGTTQLCTTDSGSGGSGSGGGGGGGGCFIGALCGEGNCR
jgi:hypothetical protein